MPLIRVSEPIADSLRQLQEDRQRALGRQFTMTEVQEMLLRAYELLRTEEAP